MSRSVWAVFLAAAAVVAAGGLVALSSTGALDDSASTAPTPTATPRTASATTSTTTSTTTEPSPTRQPNRPPATTPPPPAEIVYVFPVGGCVASASQTHHDYPASDIFADKGCRFVAPVDGRVDEVVRVDVWEPGSNVGRDRGGLSVSVVGVDGVRYYGSHLSAIGRRIGPGVRVRAGQTLGLIGNTGSARPTPTHLHFGISWPTPPGRWWIRRGAVSPQPYLKAWRAGRHLSPVAAVARARRAYGVDRGCRSYC